MPSTNANQTKPAAKKPATTKQTKKAAKPAGKQPAKPTNGTATKQAAKPTPSAVESPVARSWEIYDSMPDARRKDAVAAAVEAGINPSTARTQYQRWLHAEVEA